VSTSNDDTGSEASFGDVATAENSTRAQSFGSIARDYDRFRPAPPADAVAWIVPDGCQLAIDIGAGTGALTRRLLERVPNVVSVEPDDRMRAVLGERAPAADPQAGTAEAIPVADGGADLVAGASMWHWVDEQRAFAEIARVLRPGGTFAVMWNGADRRAGNMSELLGRREHESEAERGHRRHVVNVPNGSPFSEPETRVFTWELPMTVDEIVGLATTYSPVIALAAAERAAFVERLQAVVRAAPGFAESNTMNVPMRCFCWRTTRTA
jgi:SAM-dependent methyltransferase